MAHSSILTLTVIAACLLACTQGLHPSHEQAPVYHLWDFINGRVQTLNECFKVLPTDLKTTFTWKPNDLHIEGACGTTDCQFTITGKEFKLGACSAPLAAPCDGYLTRIRQATHISLLSNLIRFFPTDSTEGVPLFVLADKVPGAA